MKVLKRLEIGNPDLRKNAKKVSALFLKSAKGKSLVKKMLYTMRRTNGIGLAAPQIGEKIQLVVMELRPTKSRPKLKHKGPIIVANPKIISYSKNKINGWEGCLSFEDVRAQVPRSKNVTVSYLNEKGEKVIEKAEDLWARVFQHEIDHLNGIIYIDRVEDTKTIMTFSEYKKRILSKKKK